jgi:GDP-L-fucose synthase
MICTINNMNKDSKIYVAGHNGMVGSAIWRSLLNMGYTNLVGVRHSSMDLTNQLEVNKFFQTTKPEYVIMAAAKVGGIIANSTYPAEFIYNNLQIQNNLINASYQHGITKLLFLGSSCIYPKFAEQPIKEECLLTGELESTNQWYALAKIAGIRTCQAYRKQYGCDFISAMPCNLYGTHDNFDLNNSHVLPALIRKFHTAKITNAPHVTCWGTGSPMREFLYVDDLAEACVFLMENYSDELHINVGYGVDITIKEAVESVCEVVGYEGQVTWDNTKPDGTPRKVMDSSRIKNLGWKPTTTLHDGLEKTYYWFKNNVHL